jgi:tripartite-type tricarboxylate transporter receptor subunit TctC
MASGEKEKKAPSRIQSRLRVRRAATVAALACIIAAEPAHAQYAERPYPDHAIRLIVPSGPGGPPDIVARMVAERLQSAFAQTVTVEDRAGASGAIGAKAVAAAEPDGYTLLLGFTSPLTIIPAIMKTAGFDPQRSFAAVARLTDSPPVIVVYPKFPAGSIAELIREAKAHPGKFSYASAGLGNQVHLTGEMFKLNAGIDILHVPYRGGTEMTTAVIAEQVDITFADISIALPLIREGRLKALAVVSGARRPELPGVPTMVESGFAEFRSSFWTGIVAPAGTPPGIVAKLNAAINDCLKSAEMQASFARLGVETKPGTPQDFAAFIAAESQKWATVADAAGIRIE